MNEEQLPDWYTESKKGYDKLASGEIDQNDYDWKIDGLNSELIYREIGLIE